MDQESRSGVKAGRQGTGRLWPWELELELDLELELELEVRSFERSGRARWLWTLMQVKGILV